MLNRIRYNRLMFHVRESHTYAYLLGLYKTLRWGSDTGMSHETDHDWTDAYDTGMNHAEWIKGVDKNE